MEKLSNSKKLQITAENYENVDIYELSIYMMRRFLQILGAWPLRSKIYTNFLRYLLIGIWTFFFIFLIVPYSLNMFIVVKDYTIRIRLLGPLSYAIMSLYKFIALLMRSREINEILVWMANDIKAVHKKFEKNIIFENIKSAKLYISICAFCMYGSGLTYTAIFTWLQPPMIIDNVTYRMHCYQSYFVFFDARVQPAFDIVYMLHNFCSFEHFTIACAVCSIAIVSIMHICSQISIASVMLQNLSEKFDKELLRRIIQMHLRSLLFAMKLENLLSSMFLVEVLGCTLNMCLLGYYFITEYDPSTLAPYIYCFLYLSIVFNVFILCYIGDLLTEKCASIGTVAYSVDWYKLTGKEARDIILIVASSQHPVALTAGKIIVLSMPCFSNILKSAFGYMNMLRTVTAK